MAAVGKIPALRVSRATFDSLSGMLCGTFGAGMTSALIYPLVLIKSRVQASTSKISALEMLKEITEKNGYAGLYQGVVSTILSDCFAFGMYFTLQERALSFFSQKKQGAELDGTERSMATLFAGVIAVVLTHPLRNAALRITLLKKEKRENHKNVTQENQKTPALGEMFNYMINTEGYASLFKGMSASLLLISNFIIHFGLYNAVRSRFLKSYSEVPAIADFVFGAVTKAIATVLTFPMLVLEVRMQSNRYRNRNIISEGIALYKAEGTEGLFKGFWPKMIMTVIYNAFFLMFYKKLEGPIQKLLVKLLKK